MLSLLSFRDADAYVPGINDLVYGNFDPLITPVGVKMEAGREAVRAIEDYREVMAGGDAVAKAVTRPDSILRRKRGPGFVAGN